MKVKQYRKILLFALMICAAILFGCVERVLSSQLSTQQIASEWSAKENYAQISCFFSSDAAVSKDFVIQIEQKLKTALEEASEDTSDENGRTLVDCYSTQGQLTIYSDRASITARAFGVGGDFFTFHPLKLLSGNYFDGDDLNADGVVIDENVAWQLFGSNNVSGMYVEINGVQYPVRGVVKSDKGYFSEAADEEAATVYVSYQILAGTSGQTGSMDSTAGTTASATSSAAGSSTSTKSAGAYDQTSGETLDTYELLIKNPVQKFGLNALKEALGLDENSYEIVENSSRFGLVNRFSILRNFGIRSMNTKNIVFPYWENRARAYEDVAVLLLVLELLCLIYPVIFVAGRIYWLWKHKTELRQKLIANGKIFWKQLLRWIKNAKKPDFQTNKVFRRKTKEKNNG